MSQTSHFKISAIDTPEYDHLPYSDKMSHLRIKMPHIIFIILVVQCCIAKISLDYCPVLNA